MHAKSATPQKEASRYNYREAAYNTYPSIERNLCRLHEFQVRSHTTRSIRPGLSVASMGFLELLFDVLPAFEAVADYVQNDPTAAKAGYRDILDRKEPKNFYLSFWAEIYQLCSLIDLWDWRDDPDETEMRKILEALESRFLSTSRLVSGRHRLIIKIHQ